MIGSVDACAVHQANVVAVALDRRESADTSERQPLLALPYQHTEQVATLPACPAPMSMSPPFRRADNTRYRAGLPRN